MKFCGCDCEEHKTVISYSVQYLSMTPPSYYEKNR